jgi:hypothetical protein
MKIRPVGAELFHANGQRDMTQLIVAFRNFVNAPKNSYSTYTNKEAEHVEWIDSNSTL